MKFFLNSILCLCLLACSNGEQGLREQTIIQTKEEIDAQNKNLQEWSEKLELDLQKRRAFIGAVEGEFQGSFSVGDTIYSIRSYISPTIPDYEVDRTRSLEELEFELQNLNLNIQIIQWVPETQLAVGGCIFEEIKPDLRKGVVNLISENCSNTYQLYLSEKLYTETNYGPTPLEAHSARLAQKIKNGNFESVDRFEGKIRSSMSSRVIHFWMERI